MPGSSPGMTEFDAALLRNRGGQFSVGRLMEFLNRLGQDVRITVKPTRKAVGEMEGVSEIIKRISEANAPYNLSLQLFTLAG